MATLLIGGNGLVGEHLIEYLCKEGKEVISFSSRPPKTYVEGCVYVRGDVTEYGTINKIMRDYKVDTVIHNAAISHPKLFTDNPYKIYRTNVVGTLTALEAARSYEVNRFLYMSSGAVYGNVSSETISEEAELFAENPYGASKIACEHIVRNYGLDSTSLRIGFIYGPGREFECPINMLLSDCIKNGAVKWEKGIDQVLDYIYIQDCVKAIAMAASASNLPHAEYNIGGGENIPFSRIVNATQKLYPNIPIDIGRGTLGYDNLGAMSIERAAKDFGWKPVISIEKGVAKYNKWLKENL